MFGFEFSSLVWGRGATRKFWIAIVSAVMSVSLMGFGISSAHASAKQCNSLKRQLSGLSGGSSKNYAKYDAAAKRQKKQISYIQRDMRANNCRASGWGIFGKCSTLKNTLRKMESNYKALIRKRNTFRGASGKKKRAIKAKLARLNCNGKKSTTKKRTKTVVVRRGEKKETVKVPAAPTLGGFRTMCVRTCDGYYFPVSHASKKSDFKRDEAICNALCPATESKLFVHRNEDQESEDMVSLRGEPYISTSTAFDYRRGSRKPGCSCGSADLNAAGLSTGKNTTKAATKKIDPFLKSLPAPTPRPDLYADIETQHNDETGLTVDVVRQFIGKSNGDDAIASANDRKVRVVGSKFLPDPATAIDLRAPAPTRVQ